MVVGGGGDTVFLNTTDDTAIYGTDYYVAAINGAPAGSPGNDGWELDFSEGTDEVDVTIGITNNYISGSRDFDLDLSGGSGQQESLSSIGSFGAMDLGNFDVGGLATRYGDNRGLRLWWRRWR